MDPKESKEAKPSDGRLSQVEGENYSPTSDDFLPSPLREPTAFERMPAQGSVFPGAVFVVLMTGLSIARWRFPEQFDSFDVTRQSVFNGGQYWRAFSAIFVHGDMSHLLHNVPIYLFFAWILHGYFGYFASVVLPLLAGVISNLCTIYFYDDRVRLLGASGMIYGMVALWLVLYVYFDRRASWVKRVGRAFGFSLLVMFPQTYDPKVSYLAHFTGFIVGIVLGVAFIPQIKKSAPIDLEESMKLQQVDRE
jgi:rhomboid protease GluP